IWARACLEQPECHTAARRLDVRSRSNPTVFSIQRASAVGTLSRCARYFATTQLSPPVNAAYFGGLVEAAATAAVQPARTCLHRLSYGPAYTQTPTGERACTRA